MGRLAKQRKRKYRPGLFEQKTPTAPQEQQEQQEQRGEDLLQPLDAQAVEFANRVVERLNEQRTGTGRIVRMPANYGVGPATAANAMAQGMNVDNNIRPNVEGLDVDFYTWLTVATPPRANTDRT